MITGTCHFPSKLDAVLYYKPQEGGMVNAERAVNQKLREKAIFIGEPDLKPGEKLTVIDGRYHIDDGKK